MRRVSSFRSILGAAAAALLLAVSFDTTAPAQEKAKPGRISAVAQGTSSQLGQIVRVDIIIREYSTAEDQQALLEAFQKGGSNGLNRALGKMSSKGRIAITGTLGYDLNYIREFDTPTGRKIRFVTDRPVTFGERYHDTRSSDYDLSAGEIEIVADKDKSTGTLLPACQFKLDKQNHLELELRRNAWKLVNVSIDE